MKPRRKLFLLCLLFSISILFALYKGAVALSILELFQKANSDILHLRLGRIFLGVLAGAGLGVCGVVLQALLRNPLAEPYLLGISSGAGLGAILAIFLGLTSSYYSPFLAFLGALFSIVLVYNLAKEDGRIPVQSLILSGVTVAILLSGIMVFLISVSSSEAMHGVIWWLLGSLQVFDTKLLLIVSFIVILGIGIIIVLSRDLDAISLGEEEAVHLGIDIELIKKILFVVISFITGAIVCICGTIGFVGLIVPHMTRLLVGPNHRFLIPATAIAASTFLVICDTFARSLFVPMEIPIGVITSIIGAPVFIFLLKRRHKIK